MTARHVEYKKAMWRGMIAAIEANSPGWMEKHAPDVLKGFQ